VDGRDLHGGRTRHAGSGTGADDGYRHPEAFAKSSTCCGELDPVFAGTAQAGADVLQIFEPGRRCCRPRFSAGQSSRTRRIVEGVRAKMPDAKIIGFPERRRAVAAYVDATGSTPSASNGRPSRR